MLCEASKTKRILEVGLGLSGGLTCCAYPELAVTRNSKYSKNKINDLTGFKISKIAD